MKSFANIIFAAFATLLLASAALVSASQGELFGTRPVLANDRYPSWFIYEMKPGERFEDELYLENLTGKKITLRLYPQDALNTSKDNAVFKIGDEGSVSADKAVLSTWIALEAPTVDLEPYSSKQVKFTVQVPPIAEKKEYAAVIFAHMDAYEGGPTQTIKTATGEQRMNIAARVGTRMYLTVTDNPVMPQRFAPRQDAYNFYKYLLLGVTILAVFGGGYFIFQEDLRRIYKRFIS